MKEIVKRPPLLAIMVIVSGLIGCATSSKETAHPKTTEIAEFETRPSVNYSGPKAMISVARVKDVSDNKFWYTPKIGDAVASQIGAVLTASERFIVIERDKLDEIAPIESKTEWGHLEKGATLPIAYQEQADLLVISAISEFRQHDQKTGGVLGAIRRGMPEASMMMDVALIDARTSRVLASINLSEEATDVNIAAVLGIDTVDNELPVQLKRWENTPMEKVLRIIIEDALRFIVANTPGGYFQYKN